MSHVFTGCEWKHSQIPEKSLAVWMNPNQTIPGKIPGHIICVFQDLCVKGAYVCSIPYKTNQFPINST